MRRGLVQWDCSIDVPVWAFMCAPVSLVQLLAHYKADVSYHGNSSSSKGYRLAVFVRLNY